ncbi:MAG: M24 family metallopeptidase, partial [Candidatus Daviesbacteria bacterium]
MSKNSLIKTPKQLEYLRKSGFITAKALKKVLENTKVGVTLLDLEKIAEEEITKLGGAASFKTVPGYRFATCLTLTEEVVHGLPRDIKLK